MDSKAIVYFVLDDQESHASKVREIMRECGMTEDHANKTIELIHAMQEIALNWFSAGQ